MYKRNSEPNPATVSVSRADSSGPSLTNLASREVATGLARLARKGRPELVTPTGDETFEACRAIVRPTLAFSNRPNCVEGNLRRSVSAGEGGMTAAARRPIARSLRWVCSCSGAAVALAMLADPAGAAEPSAAVYVPRHANARTRRAYFVLTSRSFIMASASSYAVFAKIA
jgi:hypothetical protein